MVKQRNIVLIYILSIVTFGIYGIYWAVSTKNEMNELGANVPTAWLLIIPIANLYWVYKYCDAFANTVKKGSSPVLWFLIWIIVGFVMPAIVQLELNKLAGGAQPATTPAEPAQETTEEKPAEEPTQEAK